MCGPVRWHAGAHNDAGDSCIERGGRRTGVGVIRAKERGKFLVILKMPGDAREDVVVDHHIGINKYEHVVSSMLCAHVPRSTRPARTWTMKDAGLKRLGDRDRIIRGPVIHDDQFVILVGRLA